MHRHRHGLGQGGDGDALPPADEGQVLAEALGLLSALGTRPDHGQAAAEEADHRGHHRQGGEEAAAHGHRRESGECDAEDHGQHNSPYGQALAPVQVHRPALPGAAAHMLPPHRRRLPLGAGHSLRAGDRASLPLDIIRVAGGSAPGTSGQLSEQQNKADGPDRADQQYDGNDPGEQVPRIRSIFISIACHGHRPPVTAACSVCYSITEVLKFRWISSLKKMKD